MSDREFARLNKLLDRHNKLISHMRQEAVAARDQAARAVENSRGLQTVTDRLCGRSEFRIRSSEARVWLHRPD